MEHSAIVIFGDKFMPSCNLQLHDCTVDEAITEISLFQAEVKKYAFQSLVSMIKNSINAGEVSIVAATKLSEKEFHSGVKRANISRIPEEISGPPRHMLITFREQPLRENAGGYLP